MTNIKDHAFFGEVIESFCCKILSSFTKPSSNDFRVVVVFSLSSGDLRVIKFRKELLQSFCLELKTTLSSFSDADQRDLLIEMTKDEGLKTLLELHPVTVAMKKVPEVPPEASNELKHQYVKFIHLNAYSDLLKFDFTFDDGGSSRFSMPTSLAVCLMDLLNDACSEIEELISTN